MTFKTMMFAAALIAATAAAQAHAEDGSWKGGNNDYVIRFEKLDLDHAADRARLLGQIETAAVRLCRDVQLRIDQRACEADAKAHAVAATPASVQKALAAAEQERTGVALAAK